MEKKLGVYVPINLARNTIFPQNQLMNGSLLLTGSALGTRLFKNFVNLPIRSHQV